MTYLIILVVIALVLSPIIAMKPSARQKQLASYRIYAKSKGLMVELTELPYELRDNSFGVKNSAVYRLLLDKKDASASKPWFIFRNSQGQWFDDFEEPLAEKFLSSLTGLSNDCLMIKREERSICAYWLEKGEQDQLDNLIELLKSWKTLDLKK